MPTRPVFRSLERVLRAGLVIGSVLALSAAPAAAAPVEASDSEGHRIKLKTPARRIVSLAPHITEQLYSAGALQHVVGASDYSDFPPEAEALPRVSSAGAIDLEALLALKPDLVVAWRSSANARALERIESLGIPVFYSEPRRLTDIADGVQALGVLADTRAQGDKAANALRKHIADLEAQYAALAPVRVFYQSNENPLMTLNGKHFISDAVRICGGRNVFADAAAISPAVGLEAVLASDPDAIVTAIADPADVSWRAAWQRYPTMRAVRDGNLIALTRDAMHRHAPRAVTATISLCRALDIVRKRTVQPR